MPDHRIVIPLPAPDQPLGLGAQARAYLPLAVPMVVSRLGVAAFGIADGVMLARYSTEQLAVQGVAEPLMARVMEVGMAAVTAGLALAAQARAAGGRSALQVGQVFHNALLLALLLGGVGALAGLAGDPALRALGQPPELIEQAGRVLVILGWGVAPALVGLVCGGLLEALGRPLRVAAAVVVANLLNIALNQWWIFGGFGVPALGAVGSAWSTWVVRMALALVLLGMLWWMAGRQAYALRGRFGAAQWRAGAEQRRRGWAGAGNVAVLALLSLGLPVMAGWLGAQAVAQVTALFLTLAPAMVVAWGLGDAAGLRVAALLGHGPMGLAPGAAPARPARAPGEPGLLLAGRQLAVLLAAVLAAAVVAHLMGSRPLLALAVHDAALVDAVIPLMPLGLLALCGDAVSVFYAAMLRSLGVLRGPFFAHLGSGVLVLVLAWGLGFHLGLGLPGLLAAHGLSAVARALALAWMYEEHARRLDRLALPRSPYAQRGARP